MSMDGFLRELQHAAVSGDNLIGWIEHFLAVDDIQEAAHIANVLLLYGYIYPLTDYKSSVVKDDPTAFYRFQAPYYWISKIPKPDAMDYAIYLVKRTLRKRQKYGLEEYEQSALHRLQNMLAHKWEFICIQAANQVRLYKERRKSDKIVLEAQFGPISRLKKNCLAIFEEFLVKNAVSEINIDSKTMAITEKAIQSPTWFTFDDAKEHIYKLMKSDSYVRFLRSEDYTAVLRLAISSQNRRTYGKSSLSTSLSPVEDLASGIVKSPSCGFIR
nr:unnamed protein product [Spirometra erinaceieuropaei]